MKRIDKDSLALVRGLTQWAATIVTLIDNDESRCEAWEEEVEQLREAINQSINRFGLPN